MIKILKLLVAIVVMTLAVASLRAIEVPEEILMNQFSKITLSQKKKNPFYGAYKPVLMPHQTHLMIDCEKCHHKWQAQMEAPGKCTAIGCHHILDRNTNQENKINTASFAYHSRNNDKSCIGCHQIKKMAGEASGPVACSKCHTDN